MFLLGIYLGCTDIFYDACMGIEFRKMLVSIYLKLVVGVFMGSFVSRPVSHTNVLTKVMS